MKGLRAEILRPAHIQPRPYDHRISRWADEVTIVNIDAPIFAATPNAPAVRLERGNLPGTVKIVPVAKPEGGVGPMFGGAYVATSDGRFEYAVERLLGHRFYGAVPLHDQYEGID